MKIIQIIYIGLNSNMNDGIWVRYKITKLFTVGGFLIYIETPIWIETNYGHFDSENN